MKTLIKILLAALCLLLFASCAAETAEGPFGGGFVPMLTVEGDVENVFTLSRESAGELEWDTTDKNGSPLPCVNLAELIQKAMPRAGSYDVLLTGSDGLSALINGDNIASVSIAFSPEYAWECVNEGYPVSSKIKMLQKITVISAEGVFDPGEVVLVGADGERRALTAGRLALEPLLSLRQFEGRSELSGNYAEIYTPSLRRPVPDLLSAEKEIAVIGRDGSLAYDRGFASLEIRGNRIDYIFGSGRAVRDIAGLMADAPGFTIAEAFSDALHFLERGERVLLIELDGWGWEMLLHFKEEQPFLAGLNPRPALAAYPPVSTTGLATILTGAMPDVHGIREKGDRIPKAPDIFEAAERLGKTAAYVEGDVKLIETSLAPVLNPDKNGLNGTDDEVFEKAREYLNADLLVVHFHGIDDTATTFGPYSAETGEKMKLLDGYIRQLAGLWDGKLIITSDHGLRPVSGAGGKLGDHGVICREDMIVPYAVTDGMKN